MDHARVDYTGEGLGEDQLEPTAYRQICRWVEEANARAVVSADVPEPMAISVATVDADGCPNERDEVEAYFDSRPYGSRISAWTSRQSEPIGSRAELEAEYERRLAEFPERGETGEVPVPPFWGGYRIVPDEVEFWGGRRSRLHDRIVFTRVGEGNLDDATAWRIHRRQP